MRIEVKNHTTGTVLISNEYKSLASALEDAHFKTKLRRRDRRRHCRHNVRRRFPWKLSWNLTITTGRPKETDNV